MSVSAQRISSAHDGAARAAMIGGAAALAAAWAIAALGHGMTVHMIAHMTAVAVAAPLIAYGLAGTVLDPALRWPRLFAPLPMSIVELVTVWGWHVPAARALAAESPIGLAVEQLSFAAAGIGLWSACYGTRDAPSSARRAVAVLALLWTTMHMTLLGALITLASRPLDPAHAHADLPWGLGALADQQLGGVVMLLVGGGAYLGGGLALLAGLLRERGTEAVPR
jgi:putative membrane protein